MIGRNKAQYARRDQKRQDDEDEPSPEYGTTGNPCSLARMGGLPPSSIGLPDDAFDPPPSWWQRVKKRVFGRAR